MSRSRGQDDSRKIDKDVRDIKTPKTQKKGETDAEGGGLGEKGRGQSGRTWEVERRLWTEYYGETSHSDPTVFGLCLTPYNRDQGGEQKGD